jgi:hypothetical protein
MLDFVAEAPALAAQVGTAVGRDPDVLLALNGRGHLPDGCSVV